MVFSVSKALRSVFVNAVLLREHWQSGLAYNPLSDRMMQDPYPFYAALRARDPVHHSRLINAWVFSRYADVDAVLRNHRHFSNDPRNGTLSRRQRRMIPPADEYTLLFLDPPDHTRLRALVSKAFTAKAADTLQPRIRSIVGSLLDEIEDAGGFDLMTAVAQPLPTITIAELLGVPPEDRGRFKTWSVHRARLLEPTITRRERRAGNAASREFDAYFRSTIQARRREPRDDVVSALVQAEEEGEGVTEREILNLLRLLLVAGNETSVNMIGNGVLALLRNPDQLQRLREEPSLIPTAIEELLRFDSPVQTDFRRAAADCEVNGFPLKRRDNVVLLLGAANRDPAIFENPDRLDLSRGECAHLSFGRGIHHCLGAPLARLQGRIVLEMLLERFSRIGLLTDRPLFRESIVCRGLQSLPLRCTSA